MKLLICDDCFTVTQTPLELHLPCSVTVWDSYVTLKACNWNMKSKSTPVYSEKINLKVILGLSFEGLHPFRGTDKLAKCTKFSTESCCTHPPLIFVGKSLIISLERIKFCISLFGWSLWKLSIFLFHEKFY